MFRKVEKENREMHKNQRGQEDGFGGGFRYDVLDVELVLVSCYNILCYKLLERLGKITIRVWVEDILPKISKRSYHPLELPAFFSYSFVCVCVDIDIQMDVCVCID